MAHNPRIRPMGLWITGALYSTELEQIDATLAKAINGDDGGVWAPTAVIEIGGQGVKITTTFSVTGSASFSNGLSVTGSLATFSQGIDVQGNASVSGDLSAGTLTVSGACQIGGSLSCYANITTTGNATIGGTFNVNGSTQLAATQVSSLTCATTATITGAMQVGGVCTLAGGVNIYGASTLTKPVTSSAQGRVRKRTLGILADGNQNITADQADIVHIPTGVLAANRNYYLMQTGAAEGDEMLLFTEDGTYTATVRDSDSGDTIASLKAVSGGTPYSVRAVYRGGKWRRAETSAL